MPWHALRGTGPGRRSELIEAGPAESELIDTGQSKRFVPRDETLLRQHNPGEAMDDLLCLPASRLRTRQKRPESQA